MKTKKYECSYCHSDYMFTYEARGIKYVKCGECGRSYRVE